jgi:hypothetical protein
LKTEYRGNDPIRRQFYKDNTGTRNKLVALRLEAKDLYVDDKRKEFFSEAKLQDELDTKEPFRVLKGEALIPVGEASADHHPPLVKHWSELGGNDTDQQERERHNKDIKNIRVISWKLNIKKGPQESGYVKEVGLKFRGPDEK